MKLDSVLVFVDENGDYGNPVGIVVDKENRLTTTARQDLATRSGMSEVVFINDLQNQKVSIYTPQSEIAFAGHALIGVSYYFANILHAPAQKIRTSGGIFDTWLAGDVWWISGDVGLMPPWNFEQAISPNAVESITRQQINTKKHTMVWSWLNKTTGLIRARTFAPDWDIIEDQANGSGALVLAHRLNQSLTLIHGKGSLIYSAPHNKDQAKVGGRVGTPSTIQV